MAPETSFARRCSFLKRISKVKQQNHTYTPLPPFDQKTQARILKILSKNPHSLHCPTCQGPPQATDRESPRGPFAQDPVSKVHLQDVPGPRVRNRQKATVKQIQTYAPGGLLNAHAFVFASWSPFNFRTFMDLLTFSNRPISGSLEFDAGARRTIRHRNETRPRGWGSRGTTAPESVTSVHTNSSLMRITSFLQILAFVIARRNLFLRYFYI